MGIGFAMGFCASRRTIPGGAKPGLSAPEAAEAVVRTGQPVRSTTSAPAKIDGVYAGGG